MPNIILQISFTISGICLVIALGIILHYLSGSNYYGQEKDSLLPLGLFIGIIPILNLVAIGIGIIIFVPTYFINTGQRIRQNNIIKRSKTK